MVRRLLGVGASGFLLAGAGLAYGQFNGELRLGYSGAMGTAYELVLANEGPSDRVVQTFRVKPPLGQSVIYKTTEDILIRYENRQPTLPGGAMFLSLPRNSKSWTGLSSPQIRS